MNPALTAEATAQLQEGINLVLSRWAALRMAVENEWGAVTLSRNLSSSAHIFFIASPNPKDMLDEFMLSLNTEIGDGSIEEIAENLMVMREECLEGNFDSIKRLKETDVPSISYNKQPGSNDEDESDDDGGDNMEGENSTEMEVDAPQCQSSLNQKGTMTDDPSLKEVPEVVDGWTVVGSRRNRGRRN
ncbi:hypothetical protein Pfo_028462 [Paulownia fortunei]|nr:hypothetical protein Pfo_028462 [Paulownia fortunei]